MSFSRLVGGIVVHVVVVVGLGGGMAARVDVAAVGVAVAVVGCGCDCGCGGTLNARVGGTTSLIDLAVPRAAIVGGAGGPVGGDNRLLGGGGGGICIGGVISISLVVADEAHDDAQLLILVNCVAPRNNWSVRFGKTISCMRRVSGAFLCPEKDITVLAASSGIWGDLATVTGKSPRRKAQVALCETFHLRKNKKVKRLALVLRWWKIAWQQLRQLP